jgi:hypothetical protein
LPTTPQPPSELLALARILVEKHHIGLTESSERMAEVKDRYEGGLDGQKLEAKPKSAHSLVARGIIGEAELKHRLASVRERQQA